jgi:hypothetical protein
MTNIITEEEWISLLEKIYLTNTSERVTRTKVTVKTTKVTIPVDELKELYDNLIYNGFTDMQALVITAQAATNARTD